VLLRENHWTESVDASVLVPWREDLRLYQQPVAEYPFGGHCERCSNVDFGIEIEHDDVTDALVVGEHVGRFLSEERAKAKVDRGVAARSVGFGHVQELELWEAEPVGNRKRFRGVDVPDSHIHRDVGEYEALGRGREPMDGCCRDKQDDDGVLHVEQET
jgi:hypothetical protein